MGWFSGTSSTPACPKSCAIGAPVLGAEPSRFGALFDEKFSIIPKNREKNREFCYCNPATRINMGSQAFSTAGTGN
jgi:hypothetical protein